MKKPNAYLIVETCYKVYNKLPIHVIEITDDFYPIKYEYCIKGYNGIIFSERKNNVEFIK